MQQRLSPMQDYYAARASEYDAIYAKPERQADLRQIEAWLPPTFSQRSVLEIACGTGYWTQFIAPICERIVGIDSAPETIAVARSRIPSDKGVFIVGDAYALPVQPASFGAAFSGFWWSHIPVTDVAKFLHGLHSALQPGAPVVFLDNRFVLGSSTPITEQDADGNTYQTRRLADGTVHRVLKNFPTAQQLLDAVAPFATNVRYREWQYFWALEYSAIAV